MARAIGNASDFYRLRVTRFDEVELPDMEWREDILYRKPATPELAERDDFRVEAVDVDDETNTWILSTFRTTQDAYEWIARVEQDLAEMTRSEFEAAYFPQK